MTNQPNNDNQFDLQKKILSAVKTSFFLTAGYYLVSKMVGSPTNIPAFLLGCALYHGTILTYLNKKNNKLKEKEQNRFNSKL